jgi:hypothetical protein
MNLEMLFKRQLEGIIAKRDAAMPTEAEVSLNAS